ncbi:MAG: hypothetical protein KF841_07290 [Phycisphaerae bacterium]|nr:hypothetical protein [Phycisphaerae bacterium]
MIRKLTSHCMIIALSLIPTMGAQCAGTGPENLGPFDRGTGPTESELPSDGRVDSPADGPQDAPRDGDEEKPETVDPLESQTREFLNAKVLTEISTSSNFDPVSGIAFIDHFRSDLKLCSNGRFSYLEVKETTIGSNFSRNEFAALGKWSVRVEANPSQVLLVLNAEQVSEGELFASELRIEQNANGETFLNNTRTFVTDGDDNCE